MLLFNSIFQPIKTKLVWPLSLILFAFVVLIVAQTWLFLQWSLNIELAGRQLESALLWPAPRQVDSLPQVGDPIAFVKARSHLLAAIKQRPTDEYAYQLMGHSYLAEGDWLQAAEVLHQAHKLAPHNWLIGWETGLAYEQMESVIDNGSINAVRYAKFNPTVRKEQIWQGVGLTPEQFITRGEEALNHNRPLEALKWYERASATDSPLLFHKLFEQTAKAIVAQEKNAFSFVHRLQNVYGLPTLSVVEQVTKIPPAKFYWMSELPEAGVFIGAPFPSSEDETATMFWWTGEAVAFFFVPSEGQYLLSASFWHNHPAPVEMTIGIDNQLQLPLQFERGDNSWQKVNVPVTLTKGIHALRIGFWNDETVNGLDRNGGVRDVQLQKRR